MTICKKKKRIAVSFNQKLLKEDGRDRYSLDVNMPLLFGDTQYYHISSYILLLSIKDKMVVWRLQHINIFTFIHPIDCDG